MVERILKKKIEDMIGKYPVVTLTGPRQSGKSTLLKKAFPDYKYVSLEDIASRELANEDPRGFLKTYSDKTIIDEAQKAPDLFSYIQTHTDDAGKTGMYILAGSHNFLLMQSISQSLAGRTAALKLLPFSHKEMQDGGVLPKSIDEEIFMGSYPRIYDMGIQPNDFYPYYLQTYLERDVRQLTNVGDMSAFLRFLKLCAGRIGQLLNMTSLSIECGVAISTISRWISILGASYICYLLQPDYNNYSKRLVKTPKLYFYDTGLACSLLNIHSAEEVSTHYERGSLFENMVINNVIKEYFNEGREPDITFWRDSAGHEVDLVLHDHGQQYAYEVKSGATFSNEYFKGLFYWAKLSGTPADNCTVVYGGTEDIATSYGHVRKW